MLLVFNCSFSLVAFAEEGEPVFNAAEASQSTSDSQASMSSNSESGSTSSPENTSNDNSSNIGDSDDASQENSAQNGQYSTGANNQNSGNESIGNDLNDEVLDDEKLGEDELDEEALENEDDEKKLKLEKKEVNELLGAEDNKCGDNATWEYDVSTKTLTISGRGAMYDYDSGDTYNPKCTAPWSQYLESGIDYLNISNDITYIGACSFMNLRMYKSNVVLPSKLTGIGRYAFAEYYVGVKNSTLTIPGSVSKVSKSAFSHLHVDNLVFQKGTKEIGDDAFRQAYIKNITWTSDIQTIGEYAFYLSYLGNFTIPSGVKTIGTKAFGYLRDTTEITFEGNLPKLEEEAFLDDVLIAYYPSKNTTYSQSARDNASKQFKGVTWIENGMTASSKAGDNITWSYETGYNSSTLKFVGTGDMYDYAANNLPPWYQYLPKSTKIEIDSRITSVGAYSFYKCGNSTLTLPKKLNKIGDRAFYESAISIVLPDQVAEIGERAFYGATIWDINANFPKGVKKVGDGAFQGIRTSRSFYISFDKIEYIGDNAFNQNNSHISLNCSFPSTLRYIGDKAFAYCKSDGKELVIPENIEYIGERAIYGIKDVKFSKTSYTIPKNVSVASNYIMYGTNITSLTFNDTVKTFMPYAVAAPNSLKEIKFNCDFPNLDEEFFNNFDKGMKVVVYYPVESEGWQDGIKRLKYDSDIVTFKPMGDSTQVTFVDLKGKTIDTIAVKPGEKITEPVAPSGQKIGGWYTSKTIQYGDTKWNFDDPVVQKMTLYAGAPYTGYRVAFIEDNTKPIKLVSVKEGQKLPEPAEPKKDGKRLSGWYLMDNVYYTEYKFDRVVTEDFTLVARWTEPFASVTYHYNTENRSIGWMTTWVAQKFDYENDTIKEIESTGYFTFKGWYYDSSFTKPVPKDLKIELMKDYEVWAKWDKKLITVTFDHNDGTGKKQVFKVEYDTYPSSKIVYPTRKGYRFRGWALSKDATKAEYKAITEPMTYYAVWEGESQRIQYYVITGEDKRYITSGYQNNGTVFSRMSENIDSYMPKDYVFEGWYFDEAFKKPIPEGYIINGAMTVYGKTSPKPYTLTVDPNNGEETYQVQVPYGTVANLKTPVKEGYEFKGWCEERTNTEGKKVIVSYGGAPKVYGDKTLKAEYTYLGYTQDIRVEGVEDSFYTGQAITFKSLKVTDCGFPLIINRDYTVRYANNVNVGDATVTITFKGVYSGKKVVPFKIKPINIDPENTDADYHNMRLADEFVIYAFNNRIQKGVPKLIHEYADNSGKTTVIRSRNLVLNKDYKLEYEGIDYGTKNPDAFKAACREENGLPTPYKVKITGKGNYTGTTYFYEIITSKKLVSRLSVVGLKSSLKYTGDAIVPDFEIRDGRTLVATCKDGVFTSNELAVNILNNKNVGRAVIRIASKDGAKTYYGVKEAYFNITGTPLTSATMTGFKQNTEYADGNAILQDVVFYANAKAAREKDSTQALKVGTDYTVSYADNRNVGVATVTYTGKGLYTGKIVKKFNITGVNLTMAKVNNIENVDYNYNSSTVTQDKMEVVLGEITLKKGKDYKVTYTNNNKAGTARITITGINRYTGTINKTFRIAQADLSKVAELDITTPSVEYTKNGAKPTFKVTINGKKVSTSDYNVTYKNNRKAGNTATVTVTGKGNLKGSLSGEYEIKQCDISDLKVTITHPNFVDRAGNYKATFAVYDNDGTKLTPGVDYDNNFVYKKSDGTELGKNDKVGRYSRVKVYIKAKNNFTNEKTYTYTVDSPEPAKKTTPISSVKFTIRDYEYNGSYIYPLSANIVGIKGNTRLAEYTDFEVVSGSYRNNRNVGTATMQIKGVGKYSGTVTVRFKIKAVEVK